MSRANIQSGEKFDTDRMNQGRRSTDLGGAKSQQPGSSSVGDTTSPLAKSVGPSSPDDVASRGSSRKITGEKKSSKDDEKIIGNSESGKEADTEMLQVLPNPVPSLNVLSKRLVQVSMLRHDLNHQLWCALYTKSAREPCKF